MTNSDPLLQTIEKPTYLPKVDSFEGCDKNFESLSDVVYAIIEDNRAQRIHSEHNLDVVVAEVNANMTKISTDLYKILSSQTMIISIAIISICTTIVAVKGIFEAVVNIYKYFN